MRFTIDTKILKEAIDIVSHASTGGGMTPILENILISVQYKKVVLTANNLEMAMEYVIDSGVDIEMEGNFTVSSKFLSSFVSLLSDARVSIELLSGGSLQFTTPSSETKIKGIEASKFPLIPVFKAEQPFRIASGDLKKAIDRTLFSTAEGNIRPTLAGVYLSLKEKTATFASTDSFRLSEFILSGAVNVTESVSIIIPKKTAMELGRILPENAPVELFLSENQFLVVFGNIKVFSRLLNGHFPDYRNFFPKGYSTKGVVLRNDLIIALKRANLITKENNYNTRIAFHSESGLEISTGDTEIGAGNIRIAASVEGEDAIIGLNSAYLLEALGVIRDDYVSIDFETNLSPIMLKGVPETDG
ncbi:MAG: DNA polymerase III subunit beta, partial [Candidatus Gracilibacteria bacterium]|nr:DNA polymerase III subunit beta [Candidatus Gracilibacteria bacterium]